MGVAQWEIALVTHLFGTVPPPVEGSGNKIIRNPGVAQWEMAHVTHLFGTVPNTFLDISGHFLIFLDIS